MRRVLLLWLSLSLVGVLSAVAFGPPSAPETMESHAVRKATGGANSGDKPASPELAAPEGAGAPSREISAEAFDLLAHAVHGEARGEPYAGQVAVAAVILNRVDDPRFPDTIAEVIYEPGAFTAVADNQIDLEPDETAYEAARDAVNGVDPTGGAVYYYNPARATSDWIWSRKVVAVIGRHRFAQ